MKKSRGLKSKIIDNGKFNTTLFKGQLMDSFNKILPKIVKGLQLASKNYKKELKNPMKDDKFASPEFWDDVIETAKSIGIDLIGFAPVNENYIFDKDQTTNITSLYDYAIVIGMEMNYEAIETAPEAPAGLEALRIYAELGLAANNLADYIRSRGFGAIACHPLGGPILYPAMAVEANLGEIGKQGLLISKEFGPRQRLALIATNASPLPKFSYEEYKIAEYCKTCGTCVKMCPVNAILEEPIINKDGTITRIDSDKCFEYFYENVGCSICIKVCPFHKVGYDKLFKLKFYS